MSIWNTWKMRGKECSPEETIHRAQEIIHALGFHETVRDLEMDVENCYSCRLTLDGPIEGMIGTNGKGMTLELCHASAYGEMMERLSNRMFSAMPRFDDPHLAEMDAGMYPLYDPWSAEQPFVARYLKEKLAATIRAENPFFSAEYMVSSALEQFAPEALSGKYMTQPYYSLSDGRVEYIPTWTVIFTGSNGMAAGNTLEEAMVEGLSELLERYSQSRIFDGDVIPPEIPREFIAKYPHILRIIENIEARGTYRVRVLDCSLGQGIPTVCGLIIDLKSGMFGVKFGAQPNIAVAMERVFTESMQGSFLKQFSNNTKPDFNQFNPAHRLNKWNSMKVSSAAMPAQLLMDDATYPFVPWGEEQDRSNRDMMWEMIDRMEGLGSKIFVRDASYLGFPAVNIYATGLSEVRPLDFLELKADIFWNKVQKYFLRLGSLNDEEVKELAIFASSRRGSVIENSFSAMSQLPFNTTFLFAPFDADALYGACLYRLGRDAEAAELYAYLADRSPYMTREEDRVLIKAVRTFMDGVRDGEKKEKVLQVVKNLSPGLEEKVETLFGERKDVLSKIYPDLGGKACSEITEDGCCYREITDLYKRLFRAEKEHPADPENLRRVFQRG